MEPKRFEVLLADAETRLQRLKSLYEQWFSGIERVEPQPQRHELEAIVATMRRELPRNTALRFRFQQVVQRYTTYSTYWRRVTRQIEEGTYRRDVLRAKRLREAAEEEVRAPQQQAYELDTEIDVQAALAAVSQLPPAGDEAPSKIPPVSIRPPDGRSISPFAMPRADGAPPQSTALRSFPAPPRPGAAPSRAQVARPSQVPGIASPRAAGGVSDKAIQKLYERFIEAKRRNSERTDNVKIETVARSVRDMMPKLRKKHAGKRIGFEVVVKNGKVALKPVAK